VPNELTIKQIEEIAFAVLRSHNDDRLWRALTYESGPYDVTNATLALQDIASAFFRAGLASAPAAQPSAQGEAVAPFLFVAMDDDKRAHLTWCADEAAVREAVKGAMFFVPAGEELSAEHTEQLDGSVEELLESGALIFEGDPPLYLYRVASAPAAPAQAVPLVAKPLDDYHEDMGAVLWWCFPIEEAPYCGNPNCDNWPGYHTHWTPLQIPADPTSGIAPKAAP